MQQSPSLPSPAQAAPEPAGFPGLWRSPAVLPALILVLSGIMVSAESSTALAILLLDGSASLGILAAAAIAGMWLVSLLGLGREHWRERFMLGAGLGIGSLSLAVLGLGAIGELRRGVWPLVALLVLAALARIAVDLRRAFLARKRPEPVEPGPQDSRPTDAVAAERSRRQALALTGFHYLWLLVTPFLAVTVLAVTLPPGVLWSEEAWGYDVLEYHLAVPKEFHEAGRIFFMPYNAYSNFPLNSGMLSLLMMGLRGDPIEATFAAHVVNLGLAAVFVMGAWWVGRRYSGPAGVTAAVLAATTPWLGYLAGIAFVEPGMLAMGILSLGAMLRAAHSERAGGRWAIAAGLLAGFACGYKYTAVPMIAIPIALVSLFAQRRWSERGKQFILFGVAAVASLSPWLIRNQLNTGNPVFPLAYSVFGAKPGVWDDELQARWQRGHGWEGSGLKSDDSIVRTVLARTVLEPRMGKMLLVLAIAGIVLRRDRWTLAFLLLLAVQVAVWFTATHLFARFAVVLVIPLVVLAGRVAEHIRSRVGMAVVALVIAVGSLVNIYHFAGLYYIHTRIGGPDAKPLEAHGQLKWFVEGQWPGVDYLKIINVLEGDPKVMFVGEARTFYVRPRRDYAVVFSHHPLAQAVDRFVGEPREGKPDNGVSGDEAGGAALAAAPAESRRSGYALVLEWMSKRGVTHLLVHWLELDRLQRTYGLDRGLTPDLFTELETVGLIRIGDFTLEESGLPYATLYEVPHE